MKGGWWGVRAGWGGGVQTDILTDGHFLGTQFP